MTYVRLAHGFAYMTAEIDRFSRYVIIWEISPTPDNEFCVHCAEETFRGGYKPDIFNTDQGSQFTGEEFIRILERESVRISMDGRGRAFDNIMIERLWRTVKYEEVYLKEYTGIRDCRGRLREYFHFYNEERFHSSINGTPYEVYLAGYNPLWNGVMLPKH